MMGFRKKSPHSQVQLFKHILFTSCFVFETYEIGLLCTAHAALVRVLRTAFTRIVQNVFAQPYQNDTVRIRQCSGISAEQAREKRYRLPCAYNKYQNQTAQQIKLEFIIYFIPIHVCMRKQIRHCKNAG